MNLRRLAPKASALARLSYAPMFVILGFTGLCWILLLIMQAHLPFGNHAKLKQSEVTLLVEHKDSKEICRVSSKDKILD